MEIKLSNEDIKIRALEPEDIHFLFDVENTTDFWNVTDLLSPVSAYHLKNFIVEDSQDIYSTKQKRWVIAQKQTQIPVGFVDLFEFNPKHRRVGVGILVVKSFRQKNYAYQALQCVISYAFGQLNVHQVFAHITEDNDASIALFEKLGFKHTGTLLDWMIHEGTIKNVRIYQLLKNNLKE